MVCVYTCVYEYTCAYQWVCIYVYVHVEARGQPPMTISGTPVFIFAHIYLPPSHTTATPESTTVFSSNCGSSVTACFSGSCLANFRTWNQLPATATRYTFLTKSLLFYLPIINSEDKDWVEHLIPISQPFLFAGISERELLFCCSKPKPPPHSKSLLTTPCASLAVFRTPSDSMITFFPNYFAGSASWPKVELFN